MKNIDLSHILINTLWEKNKLSWRTRKICLRRGLFNLEDVQKALPDLRNMLSDIIVTELEKVIISAQLSAEQSTKEGNATTEIKSEQVSQKVTEEKENTHYKPFNTFSTVNGQEVNISHNPSKEQADDYEEMALRARLSKAYKDTVYSRANINSSTNTTHIQPHTDQRLHNSELIQIPPKYDLIYPQTLPQQKGEDILSIISPRALCYCTKLKILNYNMIWNHLNSADRLPSILPIYQELKNALIVFSRHHYVFGYEDFTMIETLQSASIICMTDELKQQLRKAKTTQTKKTTINKEEIAQNEEDIDDGDEFESMSEVCRNIIENKKKRQSYIKQNLEKEVFLQNIKYEMKEAGCHGSPEFGSIYPIRRFNSINLPLYRVFESENWLYQYMSQLDYYSRLLFENNINIIRSILKPYRYDWIRYDDSLEALKIKLFKHLKNNNILNISSVYASAISYLDYLVNEEIIGRVLSDSNQSLTIKAQQAQRHKNLAKWLNIQKNNQGPQLPVESVTINNPFAMSDIYEWLDYRVACYHYFAERYIHLGDINDFVMIDEHDKEEDNPFYVTIDGKFFSSFEEYCNSEELEEEEIFLRIATGSRNPQSDIEFLGITPHYDILLDEDDYEADSDSCFPDEHVPIDAVQIPFVLSQSLQSIKLTKDEMEDKYLSAESFWYNERYDIVFKKVRDFGYPRVFWKWKKHIEHETTLQDKLFKETVLGRIAISKEIYDSF